MTSDNTKSTSVGENQKNNLKIDNDLCIRCGTCTVVRPDVFKFTDDATSVTVDNSVDLTDDEIEEIISVCPVGAIKRD